MLASLVLIAGQQEHSGEGACNSARNFQRQDGGQSDCVEAIQMRMPCGGKMYACARKLGQAFWC